MKNFGLITLSSLFLLISQTVSASLWDDLWSTKDQQASKAFAEENFKKASDLFEKSQWQGAANYKQGDFQSAVSQFSNSDDSETIYNKANSLAKSQQFEQAIEDYNRVLKQDPIHEDALFNKKIVEELLKQQQEKEKQDQEKKDKENKEKQEQDSESDSESKSEQESEEDENSEQKESEDQSEQQTQEQQQKEAEQKQAELAEDLRDQKEKDQALEHWLEKIPDDPGGLLRRKMYREYQRRGRQQKEKKVW